jgi:hypothetical protein
VLFARQQGEAAPGGVALELCISCAAGALRGRRGVDGRCIDTSLNLVVLCAGASIFHNAFCPYKSAVENATASWVHLVWLLLAIAVSLRSFTIPSEIDAATSWHMGRVRGHYFPVSDRCGRDGVEAAEDTDEPPLTTRHMRAGCNANGGCTIDA